MGFECSDATLERLEWSRLAECLAQRASTARGADACREDLFAPTRASVADRLSETSEARALLDAESEVSFGGIYDLRDALAALARGSVLGGSDFAAILSTLKGVDRMARFFARAENTPRLSRLAETLPDLQSLIARIERVISAEGEVRDDASPELRAARKRVRERAGQIERRMAALLRSSELRTHLQDQFVTSREGRPVLPVRIESRGQVWGIVHDVSSSGTTVFIEPESVVEDGNRLRMAETDVRAEVERLLRELGDAVHARHDELFGAGATLETLDVAMARGRLSRQLDATAPTLGADGGAVDLKMLRHPLLMLEAGLAPDEVVPNDIVLGEGVRGLVISGPNAGGKTVAAKALGLAALAVRAGLHVPCDAGSRMPVFDRVFADIGDEQDLRAGLSTFSARMQNLGEIASSADAATLAIVDEVGDGTEPGEGASLAQAILERLVDRGATVIATTHFNRLKELAGSDDRFANASAEFDPETFAPTYRIHLGVPGSSGAMWVAQRMGLDGEVVDRARALLDTDDRKLEALTRALSELRQELEAERTTAAHARVQSEEVRGEYERRLEGLRNARETALAAMKADLEDAFKSARAEIGAVVRDLQRSGEGRKAKDRAKGRGQAANRAHARLGRIRERTAHVEEEHVPEPAPTPDPETLQPGKRVRLTGIRGEATVIEAPDRRGRLAVRVGGARTIVALERVERVLGAAPKKPTPTRTYDVERVGDTDDAPTTSCDLRGLRVDEALDRADAALHRALGTGTERVVFIHGHGTGALRQAVREWLSWAPGVARAEPAAQNEGGNGATIAVLAP